MVNCKWSCTMTDNEKEKEILDPTHNVRAIVENAVRRIDDLMNALSERVGDAIDAERRRVDEQMKLRAEYDVQLNVAEAKRIDAIRAVDVNAVSVANERATAQAAVLANQVSASAETLRALVAATAATVAQQLSQVSSGIADRLSALEKSQYENKGSSGGMRDMYGWIFGGMMALLSLGSIAYMVIHAAK